MSVVIRTDGSAAMGLGHVMRCTTLAEALRDNGTEVWFAFAELPEIHQRRIHDAGFGTLALGGQTVGVSGATTSLPPAEARAHSRVFDWERDAHQTIAALLNLSSPVDWLVVDHYAIDARWETELRVCAQRLMVIDDLADRHHECELLLDQNLGSENQSRYRARVPQNCTTLLGPRYALLRREFMVARRRARPRGGPVRRLLISFGATDPTNETAKALGAVCSRGLGDLRIDVVAPSIPESHRLRAIVGDMPGVLIHGWVDSMAELMVESDLALGAGGSTSWERCYLGLPSITVVVAENQRQATEALADAGATVAIDGRDGADEAEVVAALKRFVEDPRLLRSMSEKAFAVMGDPFPSGAELVASTMMEMA